MDKSTEKIVLGGFPPIFYVEKDIKKKREFEKKVLDETKNTSFSNLNILNIKNILKDSSKKEK